MVVRWMDGVSCPLFLANKQPRDPRSSDAPEGAEQASWGKDRVMSSPAECYPRERGIHERNQCNRGAGVFLHGCIT
jgi:hypothetical protein